MNDSALIVHFLLILASIQNKKNGVTAIENPSIIIGSAVAANDDKSDSNSEASFGVSLDTSGNFVIIGDPYYATDNWTHSTYRQGTAYMFEYDSNTNNYTQTSQLFLKDAERWDLFGIDVGISGNFAIIGSPGRDFNGTQYVGLAYIFRYNETARTWHQSHTLFASDINSNDIDDFGDTVAIDGNYAVVGAPRSDVRVGSYWEYQIGQVYVYEYDSTSDKWNEMARLVPNDPDYFVFFGTSVDISGNRVIVGTTDDSAYVFEYDSTSDVWNQKAKLEGGEDSYFGYSVGIDGDFAVVGAEAVSKAYIYEYNDGSDSWGQNKILESSNDFARFGCGVAIDDDVIVVGSYNMSQYVGAGFVYYYQGGVWNESSYSVLRSTEMSQGQMFGYRVAISSDLIVAGVQWSSNDDKVYIFDRNAVNNQTGFMIKFNYNYETGVDIVGLESSVIFGLDECELNLNIAKNQVIVAQEGCYAITFTDCDDSVVDDRTLYHGSYEIIVNGNTVAIGGYYDESESHTICTNERNTSQISYCIVPGFCNNIYGLWTYDYTDITITSYESIVGCSTVIHSGDLYIDCNGCRSCVDSHIRVCILCIVLG